MEQHFSLPFPSCAFSNTQFKTGGKLTLDLCSFQGMFSNPFHQCQATMGQGNLPAKGLQLKFSRCQLETRNDDPLLWAFQQTVHSVEFQLAWVPLCENSSAAQTRGALLAITAAWGPQTSTKRWHWCHLSSVLLKVCSGFTVITGQVMKNVIWN